jgi:hypothetical protein
MAGRIIHHNDCTWCAHRKRYPKAIDKRYELEVCSLANGLAALPEPGSPKRYCEHYLQLNCACNQCIPTGTVT